MADECSVAILKGTSERARSAMDLVREFALPSATVYRRVDELSKIGLLAVDRIVITDDGKKYSLYRSAVKDILARYSAGKVEVTVTLNEDAAARLSRLWSSMRNLK